MKKKIVISLLVVVLVLAGLAGGAYARGPHKVEWGNKLVGMGIMGLFTETSSGKEYVHSWFAFTNPDPVNSIEITKISIIHDDGTVIYEGPYILMTEDGSRHIVTRPMEPHEIWAFPLLNYMYKGGELTDPDSWLTWEEVFNQALRFYAVEIFWRPTTKSPTCALVGWQHQAFGQSAPSSVMPDFLLGESRAESPMINVTQGKK